MPRSHELRAELFRLLGHPVRLRIIELLRDGERSVGELQTALELDSSGTSQHLGILRRGGIVESTREGTSVFYRVRDERTLQLLETAREIVTATLEHSRAALDELSGEDRPAAR
ncbi:MAG: metalloregulator ArsR/SmtB family transcription factor [Thermoleophilia bacterium]